MTHQVIDGRRLAGAASGRRMIAAVLAAVLWLAWGAPDAPAQEAGPGGAAAQAFRLGALEVVVLHDGGLDIPNDGSVFGLDADREAVARVLAEAGAPRTDEVRLDINALLVRMPGHVVLIDSGYGQAGHGVLRESLAAAGVAPGEVTDVLLTHAHPDHAGGLLGAEGRPAFPAAAIRMSADEWAFMQRQRETRATAAAIRPQVATFEPGHPVLPGITPLPLYGHTPGHVIYAIASQGRTLLDIGDTAHSAIVSLARPDWTNGFDVDRAAGARQRRQELQRLAASRALVFAPHFPFPGVGRIEPDGDGFRFRPELPAER